MFNLQLTNNSTDYYLAWPIIKVLYCFEKCIRLLHNILVYRPSMLIIWFWIILHSEISEECISLTITCTKKYQQCYLKDCSNHLGMVKFFWWKTHSTCYYYYNLRQPRNEILGFLKTVSKFWIENTDRQSMFEKSGRYQIRANFNS